MKKRLFLLCLSVLLLLPISGCSQKSTHSKSFHFMDTVITVTLYESKKTEAEEVFSVCESLLSELEKLWYRGNTAGEVYHLNQDRILNTPDIRTLDILRRAETVSGWTDGAFTVSVAPLVDLWNICAEENRLPSEEELNTTLATVSGTQLTVNETSVILSSGAVDLGGIGKGAAAQALLEYLSSSGISGGLVSFGSNVAVFGTKPDASPFRIALRDPFDANKSVGTLMLTEGEVLSVSGSYERYHTIGGKNYHHILDPVTGYPAESGLCCVAVVTANGADADALSTALFVLGEEEARKLYESSSVPFEAIFITDAGEIHTTSGMNEKFVIKN